MQNFVAGELIGASSRVLTVADLSANLSVAQGGALWSFDAGVSRGLRWLGAMHDPANLPGGAPTAQYTKLTAGAGVSRGFMPFGVRTQFSSTMTSQWSNDTLYSSEQIAISGPYAVRGYRDVLLFADRGLMWRNEVAFPFAFGIGNTSPLSLRPFLGADFGRAWSHDAVPGSYLSGWAVGTSLAFARVSVQLSWSGAAWRSQSVPADHLFFARLAASF
jgi:hemolysin activation/secretion protein